MTVEESQFLEYIQLQDGRPDLLTKSQLVAAIRQHGFSISDRQLTFYVSEGIIPKSVRVGSRAGAYPQVVADLVIWVLWARDGGVPIEAIKELLPLWKLLIRARSAKCLDLGELEYVVRQHVSTVEGLFAIPQVVAYVIRRHLCSKCLSNMKVIYKDGTARSMNDPEATIGFAMARLFDEQDGEEPRARWYASTRITLAASGDYSTDPTMVIVGLKPNAELPPDPDAQSHERETEEAVSSIS